jgi:uncharacterized RDD family membrane protein YckC
MPPSRAACSWLSPRSSRISRAALPNASEGERAIQAAWSLAAYPSTVKSAQSLVSCAPMGAEAPSLSTYCRACGKQIDPRAVICPACGVPQSGVVPSVGTSSARTTPSATAQQVATEAATAPLAGWWIRAGAIVLDTLILLIPGALIFLLFGPLAVLVNVGGWFAYSLLMIRDAQNGQTLGMQVLGIRVRRVDGKPVDVQVVAIRQLLMQEIVFGLLAFLVIPYLLNYLWPLWDKENRALHDMVAKTRVVRV